MSKCVVPQFSSLYVMRDEGLSLRRVLTFILLVVLLCAGHVCMCKGPFCNSDAFLGKIVLFCDFARKKIAFKAKPSFTQVTSVVCENVYNCEG